MLKINGTLIEISEVQELIKESDRKPEDGDNKFRTIDGTVYKYFACTCKDEDKKYFEELMEKEFPNPEFLGTKLIEALSEEGWILSSCIADQWMGISVSNNKTNDYMSIECDYLEYGLLSAYVIAKQIKTKNK